MGDAPRNLADQIVPTIDVTEFYLLNRETLADTTSEATVGTRGRWLVPPGELWYVHSWAAYSTILVAGNTFRMSMGFGLNNVYFPGGAHSVTGGPGEVVSCFLKDPIWIGPGTFAAYLIEEITGPAINVLHQITFSRLKI